MNFLAFLLGDEELQEVSQFDPNKHLRKWLEKFLLFEKEIDSESFGWKEAANILQHNCEQYLNSSPIEYDEQRLLHRDKNEYMVFIVQFLIYFIVFEEEQYLECKWKLKAEQQRELQEKVERMAMVVKKKIQENAKKRNQEANFSELLSNIRSLELKVEQLREKNALLEGSLESRVQMKESHS